MPQNCSRDCGITLAVIGHSVLFNLQCKRRRAAVRRYIDIFTMLNIVYLVDGSGRFTGSTVQWSVIQSAPHVLHLDGSAAFLPLVLFDDEWWALFGIGCRCWLACLFLSLYLPLPYLYQRQLY